MKKPWILISTAVVLLSIIGLWLYVFFGGEDARNDIYTAFGLTGDEVIFDLEEFFTDTATSTPTTLRQLSLRNVIGYIPLEVSSSTPRTVRFAEAGTGHIYSVNVADGAEERISNITIPQARHAVFSQDGAYALIMTTTNEVTVITLPTETSAVSERSLAIRPISIGFASDNTVLYATQVGQSVVGTSYEIADETSTTIFTLPFREAEIIWGTSVSGPHYAYPKTAASLLGALYELRQQVMTRLPISGFGLSAHVKDGTIVYSIIEEGKYKSYIYTTATDTRVPMNTNSIPEKCTSVGSGIVCATHVDMLKNQSIESWYQGETMFSDSLWYYIPEVELSTEIENLSVSAGRALDIIRPTWDKNALYFINKTDSGLWIYENDFSVTIPNN